jgi:hypothetical protein
VFAYFFLCGYIPFEGENTIKEINTITKANYYFYEEYWAKFNDKGICLKFTIVVNAQFNK